MTEQKKTPPVLRMGRIGYLNVLPIYHPLEAGILPHDYELVSGPPALLNTMAFLQTAIAEAQADVVFNTVAWTAVDDAEDHKEEACQLNRALPASIARCLKAQGAGFLVQFSTDFIFSGPGETAWKETDTPHPASVYASTKLEGEKAVLETLPDRSCVIRTACPGVCW